MKFIKNKTYIIAEIGINHEGNLKKAIQLVKEAKISGADAVKFQIFKAETLASINLKKTKDQKKNISNKESIFKMLKRVSLTLKDLLKLRKLSRKIKIDFICSIFDEESFRLSKKLKLDAYKIASSDLTDINLIKFVNKVKKPIILSTGMASKKEILNTLKILKKKKLYLLHCVSLYPCPKKLVNLKRMISLKKITNNIGYSDHSLGINSSISAISMGAKILEKHFTLNRNKSGADHLLSAEPHELKIICDYAADHAISKGNGVIEPSFAEKKMRKFFRKSIYSTKVIMKGEKISRNNIKSMRPQNFLKSEYFEKILGKKAKKKINMSEAINLKFLSK